MQAEERLPRAWAEEGWTGKASGKGTMNGSSCVVHGAPCQLFLDLVPFFSSHNEHWSIQLHYDLVR
jgi:hypothetical protein